MPTLSSEPAHAPNRYASRYAELRPRVVLVGDSTVCNQPHDSPYRGWGQYLAAALDECVAITNCAKSGASTKTFLEEGLWAEVLTLKPDWVFLQMGHNDSHAPEKPESTRAGGQYNANLRRFIGDIRSINAEPVLITPVRRFRFDAQGHLCEGTEALEPYAQVMKSIGGELEVPVADLFAASTQFFERLGAEGCNRLSPQPGEDFSHFNPEGARAVAALVAAELLRVAPPLRHCHSQLTRSLKA